MSRLKMSCIRFFFAFSYNSYILTPFLRTDYEQTEDFFHQIFFALLYNSYILTPFLRTDYEQTENVLHQIFLHSYIILTSLHLF